MVTVDIIRELFKAVVESHRVGVSWSSVWNEALDADQDQAYPACIWSPPASGVVITPPDRGSSYSYDTFTVDCLFVDTTDSDRDTAQRDDAYERMEAIARQCFYRFRQLYVLDSITYQGITIDLGIETSPTFVAVWDAAGSMRTGARLTFTIKNNIPAPCPDGYFS